MRSRFDDSGLCAHALARADGYSLVTRCSGRGKVLLESEELRVSGCSPMAFLVATLGDAGNRGHKGPMRITYGGLVAA